MRKLLLALGAATVLAPMTSGAVEVKPCDELGIGIAQLATPIAKYSRTFANGQITVYNVFTEEPAAADAGIAIVMPSTEEEGGYTKCVAVWGGLRNVTSMKNIAASYNAKKGLLLSIPAEYNIDGRETKKSLLNVRINQQTATVTLE